MDIIIAVPSATLNGGLNDQMDARFGRCHSFTIVTLKNKEIIEVKVTPNPAYEELGGAGVLASQAVHNSGATEVIVGSLGPNAINSLNSLKIKAYHVSSNNLSVKEAIDLYLDGKLEILESANVVKHHGGM
ncbi:MAG: NifB/NifX family molybdenum-iron cluster-binding protein [Candidatus Lokiarchaeota archaeon]|nr:NifB/NifX family molybdenum-iron cluster-binding protein [Candidatus Lokiarchaeota archaeon]